LYANGFRYYFTPLPGYFSPFPHGTCPLSVFWEYLGLSGGPDRFTRDFSGPVLLGILPTAARHFDYGTGTLYGRPFKIVHLYRARQCVLRQKYVKVPQPRPCNACRLSHMIGLASSDFARHYSRNHCCFLFLWVLRCFTSPRSLYPPYIFRRESPGRIATPGGVSPFGNPRIKVRLSTPRGLSQISTSFFGSRSQGIHRLHLET
jgi:hypothetical protein